MVAADTKAEPASHPPEEKPENLAANSPSTTSKAKKKKKQAAKPAPTLRPYYVQYMKDYPVELRSNKAKGRHAVAAADLPKGTTVCHEKGTAFVVRSDYLDQQCHVCLASLTTKLMCSDCQKAFYCSQTCLERDDTHTLVCSAMAQVDAIARSTDVEPDFLRLIALLLARRARGGVQEEEPVPNAPTPYWCTEDLVSHRSKADPGFLEVFGEAAPRLLSELPEQAQIPVDEIITLACRINSNAHGLGDNEARNTDVALGLFPVGAMFFNHACNPTCAFVGTENGKLAFRTIRDVGQGEELTVSYIDVYAPRDERRNTLLGSKHFWCKCKRCTTPMDESVDRFLQSVTCDQCGEDVYVIPPAPIDLVVQGKSSLDEPASEYKCAKCGHTSPSEDVASRVKQAESQYMEAMKAIRRERNYRRARAKLEPLVKKETKPGDLHPQNAVRLNASIPLMNCLRHEEDLTAAIDVNKAILDFMERNARQNLPENTPEVSDFWQNLGEMCDMMAAKYQALGSGPLVKRWKKEAQTAFANTIRIRSVVFGKDHPKTKLAQRLMTRV